MNESQKNVQLVNAQSNMVFGGSAYGEFRVLMRAFQSALFHVKQVNLRRRMLIRANYAEERVKCTLCTRACAKMCATMMSVSRAMSRLRRMFDVNRLHGTCWNLSKSVFRHFCLRFLQLIENMGIPSYCKMPRRARNKYERQPGRPIPCTRVWCSSTGSAHDIDRYARALPFLHSLKFDIMNFCHDRTRGFSARALR